ncbi:SDR family oxidoreductase [Candidatus Woesearchaeota archaeon]|nr:SDR family oxidoreductase [Candidatus Woesearchaeota archaeon]
MKTALITGANKGIGFAVAKGLSDKGIKVIMAARDESKGKEAAKKVKNAAFIRIDVTDEKTIKEAAKQIEKEFRKLDILINNAGILLDREKNIEDVGIETIKKTLETNFYGPLRVSQAFLPLLKKSEGPRIINMSSMMGSLSAGAGGYPAYRISKTALNALTVNLAADFPNIKVNSTHPGWVRTDMGGKNASISAEEGADTAVWLATEKNTPTGKFFYNRKEIDW